MLIPANRVESTLAVAFTQGTSTEIALASVTNFPAKSVVYIDDDVEWCLVKYALVDTPKLKTLTNPLAVYQSSGANGHEFPIGTQVCVVAAADLVEQLLLKTATDKTIAGGVISVDSTKQFAAYLVETEGGIPTDNLDTINGGAEGMLILLRAKDAAHTVVAKHGTGNILTNGADISLTDTYLYILLAYDTALTKWVVVGGGTFAGITIADVVFYCNYSTGNDATGDGSIGTPWKTLNKVLSYIRGQCPLIIHTATIRMGALEDLTVAPDFSGIFVLGNLIVEGHNGTNPLYEHGTCRAASATTTINSKANGVPTNDIYNGGKFWIYEGTGAGEQRGITDCTDGGATPTIVVDGANFNTDTDTDYVVVGEVGLNNTSGSNVNLIIPASLGKVIIRGIQIVSLRISKLPGTATVTDCYIPNAYTNAVLVDLCPPGFESFTYCYLYTAHATSYAFRWKNGSYVNLYYSLVKAVNTVRVQYSTLVECYHSRLQATTTNVNVASASGVLDLLATCTETGTDITDVGTFGYTDFA